MPLIPEFARQSQADFCKFKASLVYKVSSRTARTVTQGFSVVLVLLYTLIFRTILQELALVERE